LLILFYLIIPAVDEIVSALSTAQSPIVICSYLGRNKAAVPELAKLCENLGLPVFEACPQAVNISQSHFAYQGAYWNGGKDISEISDADFVLVLDSDVPWIPVNNRPNVNAKIYHLDVDPLKDTMPLWYISALGRWRTDNAVALRQINVAIESELASIKSQVSKRITALKEKQQQRNSRLVKLESISDTVNTPYVMSFVRKLLPKGSVIMNESISNYVAVWEHIQPQYPGDMYTSGAGSLGWGIGAALGASLAVRAKGAIAAAIVGGKISWYRNYTKE
jgi:acetolactate synthase-1/2/3 large subunit